MDIVTLCRLASVNDESFSPHGQHDEGAPLNREEAQRFWILNRPEAHLMPLEASDAYKAGLQTAAQSCLGELGGTIVRPCPYPAESAAAEEFQRGVQEGFDLLTRWQRQ